MIFTQNTKISHKTSPYSTGTYLRSENVDFQDLDADNAILGLTNIKVSKVWISKDEKTQAFSKFSCLHWQS
jgi:hypothetical protein